MMASVPMIRLTVSAGPGRPIPDEQVSQIVEGIEHFSSVFEDLTGRPPSTLESFG